MYNLFLDDERFPSGDSMDWVVVRSYDEAVAQVLNWGFPSFISFDHDLGPDEKTGYDFAKWIVELDMDHGVIDVENFEFYVHSQNPVGKENIEKLLENYLKMK